MNCFEDFTNNFPLSFLNNLTTDEYNDQMLFYKLGDFTFDKLSYLHGPYLKSGTIDKIKDFDIDDLYDDCVIITCDINKFIEYHSNITKRYYLIISFTDCDVPLKGDYYKKEFINLLNSKYLIKCLTVNRSITHNKLLDFPITIWPWFKDIIKNYNISNLPNRNKLCFGGCWHSPKQLPHGKERDLIRKTLLQQQYKFIDIFEPSGGEDYINLLLSYKYQISPRGCGIDCFRTWESLYLGCIPIILTNCNDDIYKDLPVLIITSFSDLTEKMLDENYNKMKDRLFNLNKFKEKHWKDLLI